MHTRIVITNLAPAPVIAVIANSEPDARELARQLGVELTNSVIVGKLAEPYRQLARGTPCALFHGSEGHVMHVPTDAVPASSPLASQRTTDTVATLVPAQPGTIQLDAGPASPGTPEPDQRDEEVAVLREEVDGLTQQLVTVKSALDVALKLNESAAANERTALSELTALKATYAQLAERCRLAEQDRDMLKARLDVERDEHARQLADAQKKLDDATAKLDRLDRAELADDADDADDGDVAPNDV